MNRRLVFVASLAIAGVLGLTASLRAAAPAGRFVINGNIVTDTVTGLVWQKLPDGTGRNYTNGAAYCNGNTPALPGTGWRLPTLKELSTLFDPAATTSPRWDSSFGGTATSSYWTSDQRPPGCVGGGACQMEFDFSTGIVGSAYPTSATASLFERCVR